MSKRVIVLTGIAFAVFLVLSLMTFYAPIPHDLALQKCAEKGWEPNGLTLAQQNKVTSVGGRTEIFEFRTTAHDPPRLIRVVLGRRALGFSWTLLEYSEGAEEER